MVGLALFFLFLSLPASLQGQDEDPREKLRHVEETISTSTEQLEELARKEKALKQQKESLRKQLITTAGKVQKLEQALSDLEGKVANLSERESSRVGSLVQQRDQVVALLGALQRLARQPPHAILAGRASPVDTVRSAMLLGIAIPSLETQATLLRQELHGLATLRQDIAARRAAISDMAEALTQQQQEVARLLNEKAQVLTRTESERRRIAERLARLAKDARDVRHLLEKLEKRNAQIRAQARAAPPTPPTPSGRGQPSLPRSGGTRTASLPPGAPAPSGLGAGDLRDFPKPRQGALEMPARGTILRRFGEKNRVGNESKGVEFTTRPGAQVVASFDGKVVFAGPFRGYGRILLIEHKGGYHTLLSGIHQNYVDVDSVLRAGEPVGVMGSGEDGPPTLYLELRRRGKPINPLPWLASRDGKVTG